MTYLVRVMVFNATFNNISAISWRSVLFMEETGVPRENLPRVAVQVTTQKPKDGEHKPHHKPGMNAGAPEGWGHIYIIII